MNRIRRNPISDLFRGLACYWQGVGWLRRHVRYLFLLFVPIILGFMALILSWQLFFTYEEEVLSWFLFKKPDGFFWSSLYYLGQMLIYLGFLLITFLVGFLTTNVLAAPIYEVVSVAVEKDLYGRVADDLGFWKSIKLIAEEFKKALFVFAISISFLLIPGLNVLAFLCAAFLLGWEFYDYPLARRGWSFTQRLRLVRKDFFAVTAFGLWLIIPFIQFFMVPLAIAGGTKLSLTTLKESLKR